MKLLIITKIRIGLIIGLLVFSVLPIEKVFSADIGIGLFVGTAMVPGAPTNFVGTALSSSQISLSWLPSGTSTVRYNLYRSNIFLATITEPYYLDTGLSAK